MSKLKEVFESVTEEEILVLCNKELNNNQKYQSVLEFLNGSIEINGEFPVPTKEESFWYFKFNLKDLNSRKTEDHITYLSMATTKSKRSYCNRKKVGALIVKGENIIAQGYNGTPSKFENECEDCKGETKWYVQHAEANALYKVATSSESSEGATLYNTLCPCKDCSKMLLGCKIKNVFFNKIYKTFEGVELLLRGGVNIYFIPKQLS